MMRRPPSLFLRLLLLTIPLEGTVMAILGASLLYWVDLQGWAVTSQQLSAKAESLMSSLEPEDGGQVELPDQLLTSLEGYLLRIKDPAGRVLVEQPQGWYERARPGAARLAKYSGRIIALDQEEYLVFQKRFELSEEDQEEVGAKGGSFAMTMAIPVSPLYQRHSALVRIAWSLGATLLCLLVFLQWLIFRFGLRPIRSLIQHLGPGQSDRLRRMDPQTVPRELEAIATEINALLERLEVQLERERRFASLAAHQLKTPVTIVKSTLQAALVPGTGPLDHARALHEALEDVTRLEDMAKALLNLARWSSASAEDLSSYATVDLQALVLELAEDWRERLIAEKMTLDTDLTACSVKGEPTALGCLFENLLANAAQYAGAGERIVLRISREDHEIQAIVMDTGTTIPESERLALFTPFQRGRMAYKTRRAGSGLGLAIAEAIAKAHGGVLTYSVPPEGGNQFTLRLPSTEEEMGE